MLKRITVAVLAVLFICAVDSQAQTPSQTPGTTEDLNRALQRTLAEVEAIKKAQDERQRELTETRKKVSDYESKNQALTAECTALVRRTHQIEEEIIRLRIALTEKELEAVALRAERDKYRRERNRAHKRVWVLAIVAAIASAIAVSK